jgi:hypothetical protein
MRQSVILLVSLCIAGCFTLPQGGGSGAGYVGDRTSFSLNEVVASVVVAGAAKPYQNLHIGLAAIINPRRTSWYDPSDVRSLLKRLEARVDARVVETLLAVGPIQVSGLASLRTRLEQEAQIVVDQALAGWKHADEYEVRVVVASLYLTNGSVGRPPPKDAWWW